MPRRPHRSGQRQLYETVSYNAATSPLTMLNVGGALYNISDCKTISLADRFGSTFHAGFTRGTGASTADKKITAFSVTAMPELESYALMMAGLGMLGAPFNYLIR